MTVQGFWGSFFNLCAIYYTIQLIRCALISFVVFAFVFLLRKTLLKNKIFLKGALWSLFIPVLFVGKMKFFYENTIGILLFTWWTGICINHVWLCWLYLCGVFAYAALLFGRRRKLKKIVAKIEKREIDGTSIYVADVPVTPSTIGVFKPKIVMPEVMLKGYGRNELRLILLHEKTHIRLGHLLFYFLWDGLRALLWLNPLLAVGTKFFREDMEEICDFVTIRQSGGKAYAYGQLLLKSMRVLQAESEDFNMYAAFAGDKGYWDIRRRVARIARYRPYKRMMAVGTSIAVLLCVMGAVVWIQGISYHRYNESDIMFTYGYDGGDVTFFDDSDALRRMISYDDSYVYVDREAFEDYLRKNNAAGEISIVFGGFYKLPGFVGAGCSCYYEPSSGEKTVKIPYENPSDNWMVRLVKML